MKVCLICVEIFAWGKYGGFGRATRTIGRELAARGIEVTAVVPRRGAQKAIEDLDGISVYGFPLRSPWRAAPLLREIDADIYHSCEPSLSTFYAQRVAPHRKHIVTVRDPRDAHDWWLEFVKPSLSHAQVLANYLYETNPLARYAVKRADAVFATSPDLVAKVARIYRGGRPPEFLPTPFEFPEALAKSVKPRVCYVARLDRRKRPELFLELAGQFPEIEFIAVGGSRDRGWEASLRRRYGHLPNLEMTGFVDQFASPRLFEILGTSWIMVNTATREGLPNAFIEALAHRCALLSAVNTASLATRFGYHAASGDFATGLRWLLENERWRQLGEDGRSWAREHFATRHAIDRHIEAYDRALRA
jgi:glycosyltransferase involved in cell wall biosynthesis